MLWKEWVGSSGVMGPSVIPTTSLVKSIRPIRTISYYPLAVSDQDHVTSGGSDGNRGLRSTRGRPPWRPNRYDLVFGLGICSLIYGAIVASPVISAALIGVGPVLMMTGLGMKRDGR